MSTNPLSPLRKYQEAGASSAPDLLQYGANPGSAFFEPHLGALGPYGNPSPLAPPARHTPPPAAHTIPEPRTTTPEAAHEAFTEALVNSLNAHGLGNHYASSAALARHAQAVGVLKNITRVHYPAVVREWARVLASGEEAGAGFKGYLTAVEGRIGRKRKRVSTLLGRFRSADS